MKYENRPGYAKRDRRQQRESLNKKRRSERPAPSARSVRQWGSDVTAGVHEISGPPAPNNRSRSRRGMHGVTARSRFEAPIRLDPGEPARIPGVPGVPGRQASSAPRRRRADRRRQKARARAWKCVFAGALLLGLVVWATHTRYLAIRAELVQGNTLTSTATILRAAAVPNGSNLLRVSAREIRLRLLRLPAVEDVDVIRRFPHTLILTVRERIPWSAIQAGGKTFLVDRDFKTIGLATGSVKQMPAVVLAGATPQEIPVIGSGVQSPDVIAALRCFQITGSPSFGLTVSHVFIDPSGKLWLNVNGIGKALVGPAQDLGKKLTTLATIVRNSPEILEKAEFLDLQNPVSPAYAPRRSTGKAAGG